MRRRRYRPALLMRVSVALYSLACLVYILYFTYVVRVFSGVPRKSSPMAIFNLAPAPVVARKVSDPIDLGQFDSRYSGWVIVVDLDTTLEANDLIAQVSDDSSPVKERATAMQAWLSIMLAAWNFVDDNGNPLPQPRDGGVKFCRQDLIEPISKAIAQAITPKKA